MHYMSSALFIARNLWLQKSSPTEKSGWALHSALFPISISNDPHEAAEREEE